MGTLLFEITPWLPFEHEHEVPYEWRQKMVPKRIGEPTRTDDTGLVPLSGHVSHRCRTQG
jgi:hypothetical protein